VAATEEKKKKGPDCLRSPAGGKRKEFLIAAPSKAERRKSPSGSGRGKGGKRTVCSPRKGKKKSLTLSGKKALPFNKKQKKRRNDALLPRPEGKRKKVGYYWNPLRGRFAILLCGRLERSRRTRRFWEEKPIRRCSRKKGEKARSSSELSWGRQRGKDDLPARRGKG